VSVKEMSPDDVSKIQFAQETVFMVGFSEHGKTVWFPNPKEFLECQLYYGTPCPIELVLLFGSRTPL
jgi:hypothetical protein